MQTLTPDQEESHLTAAVQRCCEAYHRVLAIPRPPDGDGSSETFARKAYRDVMPFLTNSLNIDAFIACVAHGMLLKAIKFEEGSKLLYAAQVAIGSRRACQQAARANPSPQKKSDTTPTPPSEKEHSAPRVSADPTPHPPAQLKPQPLPPTPPPSPSSTQKFPVRADREHADLLQHTEKCLMGCIERGAS